MDTFKRVVTVLGILVVVFIVLVAWKYPEQQIKKAKFDFEIQSPEEQLLKLEALIMEDRKILREYDIFRGSKGERDAGPFLNPIVQWDSRGPSKIKIPRELVDKLNATDWVALEVDFKPLNLDFSWMTRLHDFDHWATDLNNPYVDLAQRPSLYTLPMPGYRELTNWAKLRLIHGRLTKTMPEALKDVRQLTRLIFTNDYLVSSVVAVSLLRLEGIFVQNYNPKIFGGWKTIPNDVLIRARRYFWGTPEMVDSRLSDETYERFSVTDVGQCQMISEGMSKNLIVRDFLKSTYPKAVQRFTETVRNSLHTCRKSVVHLMWEDPQWKPLGEQPDSEKSLVKPENESVWKWKLLMIHPRAEEFFAYTMFSLSAPNYLKRYQESPGKTE